MKKQQVISGVFLLVLFILPCCFAYGVKPPESTTPKMLAENRLPDMPLYFIENRGQLDNRVKQYVRGVNGAVYFTESGIVFDLFSNSEAPPGIKKDLHRFSYSMKPSGNDGKVKLIPEGELSGKAHFFIGNDNSKWLKNVPLAKSVRYEDIFEGIDLKVYGTNRRMEYDFILAPGANPQNIKMTIEGVESLGMDESGNLVIATALGEIKHQTPLMYQVIDGRREIVKGGYKIAGNTFGFHVEDYDPARVLVIDPLTQTFATYLGGMLTDYCSSIAVDNVGYIYVAGTTQSDDFPTRNGYGLFNGADDVFIAKLDPVDGSLMYSTYLGGAMQDMANDIAVDSGSVYVVGNTFSNDFPTYSIDPSVTVTTRAPGSGDGFVTKISANGSQMTYSTYFGESGVDTVNGVAVLEGAAHITGSVSADVFVKKYTDVGKMAYYQVFGGSGVDVGEDIDVDQWGQAYVTGSTQSAGFMRGLTTEDAVYQWNYGGGDTDVFVLKLWPGGRFAYSTLLGGSGSETAIGIRAYSSDYSDRFGDRGMVFLTGRTSSRDFPTTQNAFQKNYAGGLSDAFLTVLDIQNYSLRFSTYIGGNGIDEAWDIDKAVPHFNNTHVVGFTDSTDFPTTNNAFQERYGGGAADGFLAKFDWSTGVVGYVTYYGGNDSDALTGVSVFNSKVTAAGSTASVNIPPPHGFQAVYGGGFEDGLVVRFDELLGGVLTPIEEDFENGQTANWAADDSRTWSVEATNSGRAYVMNGTGGNELRVTQYKKSFCDFVYEADVTKTAGDPGNTVNSYGLIFRSDSDGDNYYEFMITADGSYRIAGRVNGVFMRLVNWADSNAIRQGFGQVNNLKVSAQGDRLNFYINDQLIQNLQDDSIECGYLGLMALDDGVAGNQDTVRFDNVWIQPLK